MLTGGACYATADEHSTLVFGYYSLGCNGMGTYTGELSCLCLSGLLMGHNWVHFAYRP